MSDLRRTPLYPLQAEAGARFVPFAGWEMPVQYRGVIDEHHAVRKQVGLFDVSHMGELRVSGARAAAALDRAITNDLGKLQDGGALYTVMCMENGGIVDDLIIYREAADSYFVVVNASRVAADIAHLQRVLEVGNGCALEDLSDDTALLALQGPQAFDVLAKVSAVKGAAMQPFTFVDAEVSGIPNVRVARTGYTGEDGVELYLPSAQSPALWRALVEAGTPHGLLPCGLGARDTLRLEMGYALYGQDIDLEHNPLEAGLAWVVKFDKPAFVGREALSQVKAKGPSRRLVGLSMRDRGIPRAGYAVLREAASIGVVTSGTHSPTLGIPIGVGYVEAAYSKVGTEIAVDIRGRAVPAVVVKPPFYQRNKT